MLHYKNLTIIGTSHIARASIKEVIEILEREKPEFIALELDEQRLHSLFSKEKRNNLEVLKALGVKVFLLNLLGSYLQKKLGNLVGVAPGSEMKKAAIIAKKQKSKLVLIDQDVRITLKKLLKIPRKEKWRIFTDSLKGMIKKEERIAIDLTQVPKKDFILDILKRIKERYPSIYQVLIEDRNIHMGKSLYTLMTQFPQEKIIAIMGAGHEEGVLLEIQKNEKLSAH